MLQFFKDMLSNSENISTKRVVGILAFLVIITIVYMNLFTGRTVTQFILDYVFYICLTSLGLTTLEKFSESFKTPKK